MRQLLENFRKSVKELYEDEELEESSNPQWVQDQIGQGIKKVKDGYHLMKDALRGNQMSPDPEFKERLTILRDAIDYFDENFASPEDPAPGRNDPYADHGKPDKPDIYKNG